MKYFLKCFFILISTTTGGQNIDQNWVFHDVKNEHTKVVIPKNETNYLHLKNNCFTYKLISENKFEAEGEYLLQNKLLFLHRTKPTDTIRRYKITEYTESTLVLKEGETTYTLKKELYNNLNSKTKSTPNKSIIPSKGFTINSLWRGVLGMISLLLIAFLLSNDKKNINWKTVGLGIFFQLLIAICVLKVTFFKLIFEFIGKIFIQVLNFTQAGSEFVFGEIINVESYGFIFAFQVLPTILFFSALTSLLFYLGIIQKTVKAMGFILSKILGISGPESLSVAGNVFLGQTEAPLLIKAYLEKMNGSEILLVMVGGMATVAGAVLAAYIGFLGGNDETLKLFYAQHLLAASVMAAPGAIVISKILYPQTQKVNNTLSVSSEKIGTNVLDAIATGTTEGLKLAVNVGAMLLVFVSFIAMINFGFEKIGTIGGMNYWININTPYENLSLEMILGYAFSPLMWLIGIAKEDMALMGQLLGIKLAASEFVGYIQLAELKNISKTTHLSYNKSVIMATYMLCGFANFASIGIQIAGIGSLAPNQRKKLSKLGIKALIGGTIVSLISATIAGMIIG
ncbi:Na+ dependent nucleoside transporter [Flavobacteriaceae bacterium]|nr:Na+ dependent nucleoside transporter [Flavobacteriaceae bacterium]